MMHPIKRLLQIGIIFGIIISIFPHQALAVEPELCQPEHGWIRGDANNDKKIDLADAVFTLYSLFHGGPNAVCFEAADFNSDGLIDLADPVATINWLHLGYGRPYPLSNPADHNVIRNFMVMVQDFYDSRNYIDTASIKELTQTAFAVDNPEAYFFLPQTLVEAALNEQIFRTLGANWYSLEALAAIDRFGELGILHSSYTDEVQESIAAIKSDIQQVLYPPDILQEGGEYPLIKKLESNYFSSIVAVYLVGVKVILECRAKPSICGGIPYTGTKYEAKYGAALGMGFKLIQRKEVTGGGGINAPKCCGSRVTIGSE